MVDQVRAHPNVLIVIIINVKLFYLISKAFSWKEKQLLRLNSKQKKDVKFRPFGDFEQLKEIFDSSKGDFIIDFDEKVKFEEPAEKMKKMQEKINDKKVIDVARLFGSQKTSSYHLPKKRKIYKYFDYARVFGQREKSVRDTA